MKTITTSKKGRQAVILEDHTIVKHSDGHFSVHYDGGANGNPAEFDPAPFIEAFEKYKAEKEAARLKKLEEDKIKEVARIATLKERIKKCSTPVELAKEFSDELKAVEIANHWSDLYEGRSKRGLLIFGRAGFEIMEMAIEIHGIEGQFGEATNRAGEHHHTFSRNASSLQDYQKIEHFRSDHYTERTKETEEEVFLERVREAETMERVAEITREFEAFEDGIYHNASESLVISANDLYDADFSGYSEDVYQYSFAFCFEGYEFHAEQEEEVED